jgi:hypothetical protein
MGPPANPAHTREWNLDEFERLLSDCGLNVSTATYTRSNDSKTDRATILIVAINPNHRKFSSAATATPESALL